MATITINYIRSGEEWEAEKEYDIPDEDAIQAAQLEFPTWTSMVIVITRSRPQLKRVK